MARERKGKSRGGFLSKSGHTTHQPRVQADDTGYSAGPSGAAPPPPAAPRNGYPDGYRDAPPPRRAPGHDDRYDPGTDPRDAGRQYDDRRYERPAPRYDDPRYEDPRYDGRQYDERRAPRYDPGYDDRRAPRYDDRRYDSGYDPAYDHPRAPRRAPEYDEPYDFDRPHAREAYEARRYEESRYDEPRYEDRRPEPRYTEDDYRTRRIPPPPEPGAVPGGYTGESYWGRPEVPRVAPSDARRGPGPASGPAGPPRRGPGTPTRELPGVSREATGVPTEPVDGPEAAPKPQGAGAGALLIGKAALRGTNTAARTVTRKVITASKKDGAEESGLTSLIWNQVLSYGTDSMITVALAGTVFFGASTHAARGNVLLYLLITVAPFALVAPVIGPALDRLQHGRRWTMAATGIGRAVLALVMAAHPTDLLVLYPCALGSLVFSKAYAVVRAAAAPRLVPPGMTLTQANSKLTIFGLGSTLVLGGFVGVLIKFTGSYSAGLIATAIGFAACGFFALKLPKQVDSAAAAPRHPEEPRRPRRQENVPTMARLQSWARRGFDPRLVVTLQGESALRLLSALLTIYLAFYVESTSHGLDAAIELGMVVGAAGLGNFLGTAVGTRVSMDHPELITAIAVLTNGVVCVLIAFAFDPVTAAVGMLVGMSANAMCKVGLDALIQRDVVETLRSSAFARSETFLQLAWVIGAAIGVVLPSSKGDGPLGFGIIGALMLVLGTMVFLRRRAMTMATARQDWSVRPDAPGSVVQRSAD